jgi:hypothetical protein
MVGPPGTYRGAERVDRCRVPYSARESSFLSSILRPLGLNQVYQVSR